MWRSARGSISARDAITACYTYSCCAASGLEMKVRDCLTAEEGTDREVAEFSAEMCLAALQKEYNKKGGSDNTVIERIFSLMAQLVACNLLHTRL